MEQEIEVKFLNLDHDDVRAQLRTIGAELEHPMRAMRRTMFDYPDMHLQKVNWGRVRVRDEGDKITVTYKSGNNTEYSQEIETTVGSYEKMTELLEAIGLRAFSIQESRRETWHYQDVEIVLDVWPWLKPYIEIEGKTETAIKACAAALGFDWKDAKFGNVDTAYREDYPGILSEETVGAISELRFAGQIPAWLQDRLKLQ